MPWLEILKYPKRKQRLKISSRRLRMLPEGNLFFEDYGAKTRYQDIGIAEHYDTERFSSPLGRWADYLEKKALLKCLGVLTPADFILDIPLGTGRIAGFLISRGFQVAGADISEEMMAVAKRRLEVFPNFKGAFREDAEQMTFPDRFFDAIVSVRFMGHLPPPVRVRILREMKRVTRKQLIIAYYISGFTTDISKYLQGIGRKTGHQLYPVEKEEVEKEIHEAGLKIIVDLPMLRFISECHFLILEPRDWKE
jgi:ubiquinone/menaquinone biosynthesis C-methylase UbiE